MPLLPRRVRTLASLGRTLLRQQLIITIRARVHKKCLLPCADNKIIKTYYFKELNFARKSLLTFKQVSWLIDRCAAFPSHINCLYNGLLKALLPNYSDRIAQDLHLDSLFPILICRFKWALKSIYGIVQVYYKSNKAFRQLFCSFFIKFLINFWP